MDKSVICYKGDLALTILQLQAKEYTVTSVEIIDFEFALYYEVFYA